jgi:hypothetical protein
VLSLLTAGLVVAWIGGAAGQVDLTREEDIRATFLYNFGKFVEWPESSMGEAVASFRIEVIGRDPFGGRLDQLMIGKTMQGRPIEVIHSFKEPSTTPVHIAFVSSSEVNRLGSLLDNYRQNHVLTVSAIEDFIERGGMIGFVTGPGAVRFRIDQAAVEGSQLHISSRLLALGVSRPASGI